MSPKKVIDELHNFLGKPYGGKKILRTMQYQELLRKKLYYAFFEKRRGKSLQEIKIILDIKKRKPRIKDITRIIICPNCGAIEPSENGQDSKCPSCEAQFMVIITKS